MMFVFKYLKQLSCLVLAVVNLILISYQSSYSQENNSFPYELKLKKDGLIGAGSLITMSIGGLIPSQSQEDGIDYFNNLNKNEINKFDRWATDRWNTSSDDLRGKLRWGALIGSLTIIPAVSAFSHNEANETQKLNNALTVGAMGLEGFGYVMGLTMMSKTLITRNRPYAYNNGLSYQEKIEDGEYKESFFSGTTATTSFAVFFSAKVINDLYPNSNWKYVGWGCAALYTGYVGYLAIDAGQHFPTDVISGALIGGVIGYTIPLLHQKQNKKHDISIVPTINQPGISFTLIF